MTARRFHEQLKCLGLGNAARSNLLPLPGKDYFDGYSLWCLICMRGKRTKASHLKP